MKDRALSFKEIVGIIKACGEHGVSKLKFGGLEIDFHTQPAPITAAEPIAFSFNEDLKKWENPTVETSAGSAKSETEEERRAMQEEFIRAQELITDPSLHEEEMINLAAKE
jgi:hypothetical protein